jgi:hypothetical protein
MVEEIQFLCDPEIEVCDENFVCDPDLDPLCPQPLEEIIIYTEHLKMLNYLATVPVLDFLASVYNWRTWKGSPNRRSKWDELYNLELAASIITLP